MLDEERQLQSPLVYLWILNQTTITFQRFRCGLVLRDSRAERCLIKAMNCFVWRWSEKVWSNSFKYWYTLALFRANTWMWHKLDGFLLSNPFKRTLHECLPFYRQDLFDELSTLFDGNEMNCTHETWIVLIWIVDARRLRFNIEKIEMRYPCTSLIHSFSDKFWK